MELAPIALFVYNRPEHTAMMLKALSVSYLIDKSELYIFSDGHKNDEDRKRVDQVREQLKNIKWAKKVYVFEEEINNGLANQIIGKVDFIFTKYDKIIVIEDDLIVEQSFLRFMNEMLNKFENNSNISAISGYSFYSNSLLPRYYGLNVMSSWGWGTWSGVWKNINFNIHELNNQLSKIKMDKFEFGNIQFYKLFQKQINGKIDSWAIRFYANMFINKSVCLYPNISLIKNVGFDGSGTHLSTKSIWDEPIQAKFKIYQPFSTTKEYFIIRKIIELHISRKRRNEK